MFEIGLKLWSTNIDLIQRVSELYSKKVFSYIELYVVPGTLENLPYWKNSSIPFLIHAPHSYHGVNLAQSANWEKNQKCIYEAIQYADQLNSKYIIVHGGNNGSFEETILQLKKIDEKRIVLENKPKIGLVGEKCVGWSPGEFERARNSGVLNGMVLDFGHAIYAAHSIDADPFNFIKKFLVFNPQIFHLSDGYLNQDKDEHLNLGKGEFNIKRMLSFIPNGAFVTLETPRIREVDFQDFTADVNYLKN